MTMLRTAALSDIGKVRRQNEDRLLHDKALRVFGVADGVGGLPGGAEAAQKAADEVLAAFRALGRDEQPDLRRIVEAVNRQVRDLGTQLSPMLGLGCTLTFGNVRADTLTIAHVGDSRCYGWRASGFAQLTEDHSVENEARLRRASGEFVHYDQADRHALTRCIGQPGNPTIDLIPRRLLPGDRYLFCTDGITRLVRQPELQELMSAPLEPEPMIEEIVALAIRRGGPDNASGVLLFVDEV